MKGIIVKLPDATLRQLKEQARQSGCSVAAVIREIVETPPSGVASVYGPIAAADR